MVFWRGTPDSLQLMCTVLFGLRVKDSWSWDIQESPSEKWGREIRDFQIIIIPTRLSIQNVRKGEKEQHQLTNPSERQKENPRAWHFQWQLEWTPATVTGTWATADKTQPQLCGKGTRGGGGEGKASFWADEGPALWAVSLYHVPGAKDLPGTRWHHQNTYYNSSISFLIESHSPKTLPLPSLSIIPVYLSLTSFITP